MGFDDAQLFLENAHPPGDAFYPGQTVQGRLVFRQNKDKTFRGLYVKLKGKCDVHWTTRHSRTTNGRTEHYTKNHDSHEEYVNTKLYLMGGPEGEVHLNPGEHVFPFQLALPPNCPCSYEGNYGHIRYHLKFVIDRAFKFDQEREFPITVLSRKDLNLEPDCKVPLEIGIEESYCCWCVSSGIFELQALVPAAGFCPGQTMRCEVKCSNKSNVKISFVKFEIIERRHYTATMHPDTRQDKNIILKIKKGPIPGGTTRSWTLEFEIPQMDVYNLDACSYININYEFEVTVEPSGCHQSSSQSRSIVIGNVPLREFEDDTPTADHKAQLAGPVTHYPNQSYPGAKPPYPGANSPYPGAHPPYPGAHSPYPGANSPYPGANLPYPGANSPFPGANTPYPAANSHIPGTNVPYPGTNPPYPGANPSYPGANSSYPGANPPYPGATPSHPGDANAPYPGGNSPYPGANPPYPGQTDQSLPPPYPGLQSQFPSSPGFIMPTPGKDKDGANVPLLPGPGAPYPPMPAQASPYAKASAPEPNTPHTEIEVPAFNPDYKDKDQSEPKQ